MSDQIRDRIRKLLNLGSNNPNEHEATRAMELAAAMMFKHGIERSELEEKPKVGQTKDLELDHRWELMLGQAAAYLYGCKTLRNVAAGRFTILGRPDNRQAAEDTYGYLVDQVEGLYKQSLPSGMSKKDRAEYRRTFKDACALRVYHRAVEAINNLEKKDNAVSGSTALVVIAHRQELIEEVDDFLVKIGATKGRPVRVRDDTAGARAGLSAGDHVKLHRSVR